MAINKEYQVPRADVSWNNQTLGTCRGLNANDFVVVIAENAEDTDKVLSVLNADTASEMFAAGDAVQQAGSFSAMPENAAKTFGKIMLLAPTLVAKVLARAFDEPDSWEYIRDNWTLPAQFEAASEVARLTFIDPPAFRRLVGNVMALIGNLSNDQRRTAPKIDSRG
jgi:hypothetical protein